MTAPEQQQADQSPIIHSIHESITGTWQYIVADPSTLKAVIIDPVLDFDLATKTTSTKSADELLNVVRKEKYIVERILETHAHADHLTASRYLQGELSDTKPKISIGKRITSVQETWAQKFGINKDELEGSFDSLLDDDETFKLGAIDVKVLHLPGHTPDHIGYVVGSNVFTGDSIFNPDVGSARCDFPGGSAADLFKSMKKLLSLPGNYKLYTGHDYPPAERTAVPFTTVEEQRMRNKHAKTGTDEQEFIKWRSERDSGLSEPKLIHHALQVNIRGGKMPSKGETNKI